MKTSLYELLLEKALSEKFKNKEVYFNIDETAPYSYTYLEILNLVKRYIDIFDGIEMKNQKKYVIVDNSMDSIAIFIALLYYKAIPVLLNKKDVAGDIFDDKDREFNINYREEIKNYPYDYIIANDNETFISKEVELVKIRNYIDSISNTNEVNEESNSDSKFYICTSGTTGGTPNIVLIREKELIDKVIKDFNDTYGYSYYSYNSIASISGIVFNVVLPLALDNKIYFYTNEHLHSGFKYLFDDISKFEINHLMLPRNILDYIPDTKSNLNFNSLKKIYLGGETNHLQHINKIRDIYPNIPKNIFVNSYGSTETYGKICECGEQEMIPLYINRLSLMENKVIYTYDKENIYAISDKNNVPQKLDIHYDDMIFMEVLPVSSNYHDNIEVKPITFLLGEIIVNKVKTGDIGFYFNNKLYLLGRKNDIVDVNERLTFLPSIEEMFSNIIGYKTVAVKSDIDNKILLIVNYKLDRYATDNFKKIIPIVKKCHELIEKVTDIPIAGPIFVESNNFPKSNLLMKSNRRELLKFYDTLDEFNYNIYFYDDALIQKVKEKLKYLIKEDVVVNKNNGLIAIDKRNVKVYDIINLLKYIGYTDFNELNDVFVFKIDDSILFNVFPNFNKCLFKNIDFIKDKCINSNNKFIDYFNNILERKKRYSTLKLLGKYSDDNDFTFVPLQISAINNYGDYEILYGSDLSTINEDFIDKYLLLYLESANNIYYTEHELSLKINEYKKFLYHTYQISSDLKKTFIDSVEANMSDIVLYSSLIKNISLANGFIQPQSIIDFNNIAEILVINKEQISIFNECIMFDFCKDFNAMGFNIAKLKHQKSYDTIKLANAITSQIKSIKNLNEINIVIYNMEYSLDRDNFVGSRIDEIKIKKIKELIEKLKTLQNRQIYINNEIQVLDFSKIKLFFLIKDTSLYVDPTIKQMQLLNYPKVLYNRKGVDIGKIYFVDDKKIKGGRK